MKTPQTDPIIAEVRAVRDQHAARFGYDVKAIFRDIQARQEASSQSEIASCIRSSNWSIDFPWV